MIVFHWEGTSMVLLLDDFHNIHTVRMPDNLKLSKATHMASVLLDIQQIRLCKRF